MAANFPMNFPKMYIEFICLDPLLGQTLETGPPGALIKYSCFIFSIRTHSCQVT